MTFTEHDFLTYIGKVNASESIKQTLTKFHAIMRHKKDDFRSDLTIRIYLHTAAKLLTGALTEISSSSLSQYRQAKAVIKHLATFKLISPKQAKALGFAEKKRNRNSEAKLKKRIREKYVSPELFDEFLSRLPDTESGRQLTFACRIAYHAGTRLAETLALTPADFDTINDPDMILVTVCSGKGDKDRVTSLPKTAFLQEIRQFTGFAISYEYTRDMTRQYMQKIGQARMGFHAFRHSAATHLATAGVHPFEMAAMLGHSDPKMSMHYTHSNIKNSAALRAMYQQIK